MIKQKLYQHNLTIMKIILDPDSNLLLLKIIVITSAKSPSELKYFSC